MPFTSMAQIRQANKTLGHHFFDHETIQFFRSRIGCTLIGDRFFVTSEQEPDNIRRYTVRRANDDGSIETVGEFGEYPTLADAQRAAREIASCDHTSCDLPVTYDEGDRRLCERHRDYLIETQTGFHAGCDH